MIGQTLGHYAIEGELGAGGMGVVYRATDSKLGRQVAIKVLPEHFARDPDRLARFKREARMLAALNHANIAGIHGLEEANGVHYLVLEFVPGENLAERLKRETLEVPEALRICRQIAEALEAAHDKGIIHRDLKPANVKITPEGKAKVLDLGLAKAFEPKPGDLDLSQSPTRTADMSEGKILGTAAYMSPEQARGKPLDKRTDIWSFGCVLYEVLTGKRAFGGETISDSMSAVLSRDPDWEALPRAMPPNARVLLRRCLQKDPQKRLRDIGDARLELEEALAEPARSAVQAPPARGKLPLALIGAGCLIAGALVAGLAMWSLRPKGSPAPVARFTVSLPPNEIVAPNTPSVAISTDGTKVAFAGYREGRNPSQIYLRSIGELEAKPIAGTLGGGSPFFSPDGQWLGFRHFPTRTLKKVALNGGAPVTICTWEAYGGAARWERDDSILFTPQFPGPILRVPSTGGTPQPLTRLDPKKEDHLHYSPQLLPGGQALLFSSTRSEIDNYDDARIEVQLLATGERRVLVEGGSYGYYASTGHLVYVRGGTLFAVPFSLTRLAVNGPPVPLLEGVSMGLNTPSAHFSLSPNGTLAYAPGPVVGSERTVVWVDRQGDAERLPMPPRSYLHPRLSPNGQEVVVEIEGPVHDLYKYEIARGILTKMTLQGSSHWPLWTPDGAHLTFRIWGPAGALAGASQGFTMWWMPADRSGSPERLTNIGVMQSPSSWTPDGKVMAFTQTSPETGSDVYVLAMDDPQRKPVPFAQTKFAEGSAKFSPDGRWIAYTSNESGRNEIYVKSYPGPGPSIQVSKDGGMDAVWKPSGGELYYRDGDKMMVVPVVTRPTFTASAPRTLWTGRYAQGTSSACGPPGPNSSNYDVTTDGQRFLIIKDSDTESFPSQINVVLNWTEELKRIMAEKGNSSHILPAQSWPRPALLNF
jgi:Tol biopolymer transport system component/predicted Ser/Thr protein kinase